MNVTTILRRGLAASLLLACAAALAAPAKHVVLISIDGLRPEFYRQTDWPTPNLQELAREGRSSDGVRGIFPTLTYPSHTTLVTGVAPAGHGIRYNTRFSPQGNGLWYVDAADVQAPTLWQALRQAGLTSAAVSWPISKGAPIDYNLPEIWSYTDPYDRTGPIREHATPPGLFDEVERNATGKLRALDLDYRGLAMDENNSRILAYLLRTYRPSLAAIHLVAADSAQHAVGRSGARVNKALATVDKAVGNILDALKQAGLAADTAVIVTGDHGFAAVHTSLSPNVWLRKAGLLPDAPGDGNWRARFHAAGGSAFLRLRDPGDDAALTRVRALLAALPTEQQALFRVVEVEELRREGADPEAVLALAGTSGVLFRNDATGSVLGQASGGAHGHHPDQSGLQTGFIGYGAGFARGGQAGPLALTDIAPVVARLLGIPFAAPCSAQCRALVPSP